MNQEKVIIIGLDGATWKIIDPLVSQGKLPFIKSILTKSLHGNLKSTIPSITGPAWSSFQTGVNPGKHGIFDFFLVRQNPQNPELISSDAIQAEKLWEHLGKAGKKCLLLNMPISEPIRPIRGILVSSFMTPIGAKFVEPQKYEKELLSLGYKIDILATKKYGEVPGYALSQKQKNNMVNESISIAKNRVKAMKYLAKEDDFDCYFIFFKETDFLQHLFYDGAETEKYYLALDKMLQDLCSYFQDNIRGNKHYFMISDHGFHETAHFQFSPFVWLTKLFNTNAMKDRQWVRVWQMVHGFYAIVKKFGINIRKLSLIESLRANLIDKAKHDDLSTYIDHGYLPTMRGVYLFGKMRTRENIEKIIKEAKNLEYKGKKVFLLVKQAKQVYHGPLVGEAPDVIWVPDKWITINQSPLSDEMFSDRLTYLKGDHYADRNGIIAAWGEGIKNSVKIDAHIEDILPTILYLLGVPITEKLDGKVIGQFSRKNHKTNKISEQQRIEMLINQQLEDINKN